MSQSECRCRHLPLLLPVLLVALGLAATGWFIRDGLRSFNMDDRIVSVKGLAEKNVEADLAIWTLSHSVTGNDLAQVQASSEENEKALRDYLKAIGFPEADISPSSLQSQDLLAQTYRPEGVDQGRYIVTQTLNIRTTDFSKLDKTQAQMGELLRKGVTVSAQNSPSYIFSRLNDIKPEMLAEATRNARDAAAEFAKQSGAEVGSIKRASQGVFQILPRDLQNSESEQYQRYKTVRVVSTVDFYLK